MSLFLLRVVFVIAMLVLSPGVILSHAVLLLYENIVIKIN